MKRVLYGKDIFDVAFSHVKSIFLEKRSTTESEGETGEKTEKIVPDDALLEIREELEERFPFILASACADLGTLDKEYRRSTGDEGQGEYSEFFIGLDDLFPLSEKFSFPCAMYTCSMFLIDCDGDKSDAFFERYSDAVSEISSKIAWETGQIAQKYQI